MPDLINPQFSNLLHIIRVLEVETMLLDPFSEDWIRSAHLSSYASVERVVGVCDVVVSPIKQGIRDGLLCDTVRADDSPC